MLDKLFLTEVNDFHYLNQSGCTSDPSLNDEEDWISLEVNYSEVVLASVNLIDPNSSTWKREIMNSVAEHVECRYWV